ncbi:methyltransferase domain-containing protein [Mesorhizobium sp. NBSH29]|uniref:methyltransferase domain-containing protein n=1 Tax=Mesorhizobium sp. NBSH29 TaxID=2654249 RepID=UPI001896876A|nr:methyltransferase domain-containing protein [Mesorhizobium sp. NBSH29]QPC85629.1 methyltransferase domain-containing protein [Mesorhizobium sp. NBSH29]
MEKIFDEALIVARKRRALASADAGAAFLMTRVADDLAERLSTVERRFPTAAALFSTTAHATETLRASGKVDSISRIETDGAMLGPEGGAVANAGQKIPLNPESLDLVVSLLGLQDINDIPGTLIQIRRALKPDGLFLAAFSGNGTLAELRECLLAAETEIRGGASPRVSPLADVREAGGLLQRAGFALPVADVETVTVRYDTMFGLLKDLRGMGTTNSLADRSRQPGTRHLFQRAAEIYAERFADPDGRIRATFSFIWLSGWAPHTSQQTPLKPGSAKTSLTKFLDDIETGSDRSET